MSAVEDQDDNFHEIEIDDVSEADKNSELYKYLQNNRVG